MKKNSEFETVVNPTVGELDMFLNESDDVFIKKLSNNDRLWATQKNLHQSGPYIPAEFRKGNFFPSLTVKDRIDGKGKEIWEAYFTTEWLQFGREKKRSHLVHYTSKGSETHLTTVPKAAFSYLSPASFLLIGKRSNNPEAAYLCMTVDSASDDALVLQDVFELQPDFVSGIFVPSEIKRLAKEKILDFADEVIRFWLEGKINQFASDVAAMPPTNIMADLARTKYLDLNNLTSLNPFEIIAPGDALREISRGIEWELFKDYQKKEKAVALVRLLLGDEPKNVDASGAIKALVNNFAEIDRLMLSASQQRKSRAGYSFEHHIEHLLLDGNIPFEKQVVIEAKKRPDFVLPSKRQLRKPKVESPAGLILSAKTTLRERWKQVEREMGDAELCLATVDESIAGNAIAEMATMGIRLIVPESLKKSKETEYDGHSNVLGFKEFFTEVVSPRLAGWI